MKNWGNYEVWCDGDEEYCEIVVSEKWSEYRVECLKDFVGWRIEIDYRICYDYKFGCLYE